ncbi:MAG: hypothetical protein Q8L37_02475 [Candidatus Gottesmanbacteria bacterium]|nr:hypothetical protein [Candidatus Gottesmanbacteria bacterium]
MKKFGLPIFVGLLIGGILSAGYLVWVKSRVVNAPISTQQAVSPVSLVSPTSAPVKLLTWNDPNGFSFQYPEGLVVNKHDEDRENYAHLEFTHPAHPGNVVVWGKDAAKGVSDAASWIKNEKRFIGAAILDTVLGGKPGKKAILEGVTRMLVTGTVFDSIVWTVEAKLEDAEFWTSTQGTMVNTFVFAAPKTSVSESSAEPASTSEDVAVDEEVVIE